MFEMGGKMRIDKFLKVSHLIKRRTVANEACRMGRVLLNGKKAKAGSTLKVGDILTIIYGQGDFEVKILEIAQHIKKSEASRLYEILQTKTSAFSIAEEESKIEKVEEQLAQSIGLDWGEEDNFDF